LKLNANEEDVDDVDDVDADDKEDFTCVLSLIESLRALFFEFVLIDIE
jgi:hypothetical protein